MPSDNLAPKFYTKVIINMVKPKSDRLNNVGKVLNLVYLTIKSGIYGIICVYLHKELIVKIIS